MMEIDSRGETKRGISTLNARIVVRGRVVKEKRVEAWEEATVERGTKAWNGINRGTRHYLPSFLTIRFPFMRRGLSAIFQAFDFLKGSHIPFEGCRALEHNPVFAISSLPKKAPKNVVKATIPSHEERLETDESAMGSPANPLS
eukprot:scaffold3023_cov175-Amphora_coffeaeformis.AAC.15